MHVYENLKFVLSVLLSVTAGGYIILKPNPLIAKLTSLDTLALAIYGLKLLIYSRLNDNIEHEKLVISKSNDIFFHSLINRYIYYLFIQIFYNIICNLINVSQIPYLEYFLLLTIIPGILNRMMEFNIIQKLIKLKQNVTRVLIAKLLSVLIKNSSQAFMNLEISVKDTELRNIIDNYDTAKNIFFQLLINAGILCVLSLVKTFSPNTYYYQIATFIYNYKIDPDNKLETVAFSKENQIEKYKMKIRQLVDAKKWDKLISANTLKILYLLYINRDITSNELSKFIDGFIVAGFWSSMIWSFSGWLAWIDRTNSNSIVPVCMSLIITFLKDDFINVKKMISILGGGIVGYFIDITVVSCLLCEYSYLLLCNKIMYSVTKYSIKKLISLLKQTIIINAKYIGHLVTMTLVYSFIESSNVAFYPLIFILNIMPIIISYHEKLLYVQLIPLLFGYLSDYDKIHMLKIFIIILTTLPFIGDNNIYKFKNSIKKMMVFFNTKKNNTNKNNIHVINIDAFNDDNFLNIITNSKTINDDILVLNDNLNIIENYIETIETIDKIVDKSNNNNNNKNIRDYSASLPIMKKKYTKTEIIGGTQVIIMGFDF